MTNNGRELMKTIILQLEIFIEHTNSSLEHNQLNVGGTALERLVGALINCKLLQSGGGRWGGGA